MYWDKEGCSNILCLPPLWVEAIYFVILLIANTLNCLIAFAQIYLLGERWRVCFWRPDVPAKPMEAVPISVIVPCYLPNEQTIIEGTIEHILHKLEWPGPVTLHVVYNTPVPLPFEDKLKTLDGREYAPGRKLRVVRAEGSTSKAANLNLVLSSLKDEYVALYDADHHPDPISLRLMMRRLLDTDACAVQGSTYIRNARGRRVSVLARAVDAEFFVTHFVYFPAMQQLASSGYFGGSNALWRTSVLAGYTFDETMLTEDVDVSARALLDGQLISFCPEARSGELSPAGPRALVAQRLRWFMGWEQVTHKYYWRVFFSGLTFQRKIGFCYLFHLRWILLLAAVLAAVINPLLMSPFIYPLDTWSLQIQVCVMCAVLLYCFVAVIGLSQSIRHDGRDRPLAVLSLGLFFVFGWLYVILHFSTHTVAFLKVFTGTEGGWQVTTRSIKGLTPSPATLAKVGNPMAPQTNGERRKQLKEPLLESAEEA